MSIRLYNRNIAAETAIMNFLAHLYLSPDEQKIKLGNFIADAIKGKAFNKYEKNIQRGIILHRAIDTYTDKHPVFIESANRLKRKYRMYSMVIVDIYYDHFLARHWSAYSEKDLIKFTSESYKVLVKHYHLLPARYKRILPFMIAQNWLVGYASFWSLERVFKGMARRTGYKSGMENAVIDLKKHYHLFENEFRRFFPDMIKFVSNFD